MNRGGAAACDDSVRFPEGSRREWLMAASAAAFAALYLLYFVPYDALHSDEGIGLEAAQRILRGQVMYRDFSCFLTPGSSYWLALLFRLFGNSIRTAHAALVAYGAVFAAVTYLLSRRVASRSYSLLAASIVVLAALPFRFMMLHNWDSTLLALLAFYAAVGWWQRPTRLAALAAGSLTALTFLFNQAKGAGLVLGWLLAWMLLARNEGWRWRWSPAQARSFAAGLATPLAGVFVFFTAHRSVTLMWRAWFWPLYHYRSPNACPYGFFPPGPNGQTIFSAPHLAAQILIGLLLSPLLVVDLLPWLAVAVAAFQLAHCRPAAPRGRRRAYFALLSGLMSGSLLGLLATNRPGGAELLMDFPLYAPALAWIWDRPPGSRWRRWMPALALLGGLAFTGLGMAWLQMRHAAGAPILTRRGQIVAPAQDAIMAFLNSHTSPGEATYIYPYQPIYYFLTATRNPTRYDFLALGMHSNRQYRRAVRELQRRPPRFVLFDLEFYAQNGADWPAIAPSALAHFTPVEDYLLRNDRVCGRLLGATGWTYLLLTPRHLVCPATL